MSRRETVDCIYVDAELSSGDASTKMRYREENNNEVDELSKELSGMGCIVDALKRPPNICVENCIYEGSEEEKSSRSNDNTVEEAYLSDEFEDDQSDPELETVKIAEKEMAKSEIADKKLTSKSRSSVLSNRGSRSTGDSRSGYGSLPLPQTRRINMSFSNDRLRNIERENHILLNKIMSARNTKKSSIPTPGAEIRRPPPPASIHRKQLQRKIDHENMILLRKIQRAKSSSCSFHR